MSLGSLFGGDSTQRRGRDSQFRLRSVALAGQGVEYRLVRGRRRSIGMEISLSGLTVRAPRWVSIREIEETLYERSAWILRSLSEWQARRREVLPRVWKTGAPIVYLGRELRLEVHAAKKNEIRTDLLNLTVLHREAHDENAVAALVAGWLRAEAERLIVPRVRDFAAKISSALPVVKISNARSEWGSCDHRGVIRLNWRLVQLPPELALYVVAHEVAHLVELNHSAPFWNLVEKLFPGHRRARDELDDWTALLEA